MRALLFAGAGASVELGVPTMRPMALEFMDHLRRRNAATRIRPALDEIMTSGEHDIESVIDDLERLTGAQQVLTRYADQSLDEEVVGAAREALAEAEWFVQHACERVRAEEAALLWGPTLGAAASLDGLVIASTNYDRAIEIAAETHQVAISDGFEPFGAREWTAWIGTFAATGVDLLKVHGSTDWYRVLGSDAVIKLKHPMPLFGGVALELKGTDNPGQVGGALVLPSREKLKNLAPFVDLSARMYAALDVVDVAIFLGSSFRDPDIRHLCSVGIARGCKVLVVGPGLTSAPAGPVPPGATVLDEPASRFLISTLPRLIAEGFEGIEEVAGSGPCSPILDDIHFGLDPVRSPPERCQAIENLWRERTPLPSDLLRVLIESDVEAVALDALGLVPLAWDAAELLEWCEQVAASRGSTAFSAEVSLLRSLLDGSADNPSSATTA